MGNRSIRAAGAFAAAVIETLESRMLLSAAFDITGLTAMRADPTYSAVDGAGIRVAILDTGLYAQHPDLRGNFVAYFDAVKNGANPNVPGSTNINDAQDPGGHGSHVAGTVGSTSLEIGAAPKVGLIGVRVLAAENEPQPSYDTVLAGLKWVIANQARYNIRVVNMSLGIPSTNYNQVPAANDWSATIDELERLGVTVVTASGNGYAGFMAPGASTPAVYSTISVGNTWEDAGTREDREWIGLDSGSGTGTYLVIDDNPVPDQFTTSSQRSTLPNQIAAPGTTIYSTWNGSNGQMYNTIRGTSMASPFVAGMAALMQDAALTFGGRYLQPDEVLQIMKETGDTVVDTETASTRRQPVTQNSAGQYERSGPEQNVPETGQTFKRVNVYKAMQRIRQLFGGGTAPGPTPQTTDVDNTLATAVQVPSLNGTRNYSIQSNLGTDGTNVVGANDVDLFKLVLASPGNVLFSTSNAPGGQAFDLGLRIFDSSGAAAGTRNATTGYETLSVALNAGTYYIGISSANNLNYAPTNGTGATGGQSRGDYVFTVSLSNPDPNGVIQGAVPVDLTNPDAIEPNTNVVANYFPGSLESDPNPIDPNGTRITIGDTDVDFFQVTAPDTGVLTVDTNAVTASGLPGNPVDTFVRVFQRNPQGQLSEVGSNDDDGGSTDSYLQLSVTQGFTYYVAVTTYGNSNFDPLDPRNRTSSQPEVGYYDLYISFDNGDQNGTAFDAVDFTQYATNGTVVGTIGADFGQALLGANGGYKDVDFFTFTPAANQLIDLVATSPDQSLDPVIGLWVLNQQQSTINQVANTSGSSPRLLFRATANQTYYLSIAGRGNEGFNWFAKASGSGGDTGNYNFALTQRPLGEFTGVSNDSINVHTPEPITLGSAASRDLGKDGSVFIGPRDIDIYKWTATSSATFYVRTNTSVEGSADTVIRVFNASGTEVAWNDNISSATTASAVSFTATAGQTYYFGVTGAGAGARSYNPLDGSGAQNGSTGSYAILLSDQAPPSPASVGVFRNGKWFLDANASFSWNVGDLAFNFGKAGDKPITGDWNGDGFSELGVYRNGRFILDINGNRVADAGDVSFVFGLASDSPVSGDWNGDGADDVGVFRNGKFIIDANGDRASGAGDAAVVYGLASDKPIAGNWAGGPAASVGIFRAGKFVIDANESRTFNAGDIGFAYGLNGDLPVAGDFSADGKTDVGVFRGGRFVLDANGSRSFNVGDVGFPFGLAGDIPIAGRWKPSGSQLQSPPLFAAASSSLGSAADSALHVRPMIASPFARTAIQPTAFSDPSDDPESDPLIAILD